MTSVLGSDKNGERRWRIEKQTKRFRGCRKTRAQESSTDFGRVQEKSHGSSRDCVWEEFQGFTKSSVWGVRPVKICGLWHSGRWLKESWWNLHFCQWLNWGAIEKATTDRLTLSSKTNSWMDRLSKNYNSAWLSFFCEKQYFVHTLKVSGVYF